MNLFIYLSIYLCVCYLSLFFPYLLRHIRIIYTYMCTSLRSLLLIQHDGTGYAHPVDGLVAVVDLIQDKMIRLEDHTPPDQGRKRITQEILVP